MPAFKWEKEQVDGCCARVCMRTYEKAIIACEHGRIEPKDVTYRRVVPLQ